MNSVAYKVIRTISRFSSSSNGLLNSLKEIESTDYKFSKLSKFQIGFTSLQQEIECDDVIVAYRVIDGIPSIETSFSLNDYKIDK